MYLGAIADDVTGGTDLASVLRRAGLSVIQTLDVPCVTMPRSDAVVVSLKSRTAPVRIATAASVAAASFLRDAGAEQIYFKYCSTFDSTDEGNIGPVIEALMDLLGVPFTHHALLLANHGPVVSGVDLDGAVSAAEELEETAHLFFILEGQPHWQLGPKEIEELRRV